MENELKVNKQNASLIEAMKTEQDEFSARDLRDFLKVKTPFHIWIKRRLDKNSFRQNIDYRAIEHESSTAQGNTTTRTDYLLSLDMAKHLALMEQNNQGEQFRNYFIIAEKRAKELEQVVNEQSEFIVSRRAYDFAADEINTIQFNGNDITVAIHDGRTYYVLTEVSKAVGYAHPRGNVWESVKTYLAYIPQRKQTKTFRVAPLSGLLDKYRFHSQKSQQRLALGQLARNEQERLKTIRSTANKSIQTSLPLDESVPDRTDTLLILAGKAKQLGDETIMNELLNRAMEGTN